MNEEMAQQAGVPSHARSSSRRAHRNGYRSKSLKIRFGENSDSRNRNYEKSRLKQKSSNDIPGLKKALVNAIIESYLKGVSTRNVERVISHLGVSQISGSYVSKVAQELVVKGRGFMERSINSNIPYIYIDASYFKVRVIQSERWG